MASNKGQYEELAKVLFNNLPELAPFMKYVGVFFLGFFAGVVYMQNVEEEPPKKAPTTKQTRKSSGGKTKVLQEEGNGKSTSRKSSAKKLVDVPEEVSPE